MFRRTAAVLATPQDRMCLVDEDLRTVRGGNVNQRLEVSEIAVHRINALDHDEFPLGRLTR